MAEIQGHRRLLAAVWLAIAILGLAPARAEAQAAKTDLYDRPVLAIDPGMHTGLINALDVDAAGQFAVTAGDDRTVRIWSAIDGKLLRTIYVPIGPENVGWIATGAISPDGSTIAVGGRLENIQGPYPLYFFDRESGNLIQRVGRDLPQVTQSLTFSPDGRYLAATLESKSGLRVFDRQRNWQEVFRDDNYGDDSYSASFARDGRLATSSLDGFIRLYRYDANSESPNFRSIGMPVKAPSGRSPIGLAFSPDGKRLAVGYYDAIRVDILDGTTLSLVGRHSSTEVRANPDGLDLVAWSRDGVTLFAVGGATGAQSRRFLFAWDGAGLGAERRFTYCTDDTAAGVRGLPDGQILAAGKSPCVGLMDAFGKPIWAAVGSPILDFRDQGNVMRVSGDGQVVDFGYLGSSGILMRFDVGSLKLSSSPFADGLTFAPNREGWQPLSLQPGEILESFAKNEDAKLSYQGTSIALIALNESGARKWTWSSRSVIWAVNASKDGRLVVTASTDGVIRWHRADDGRELLALQVLRDDKKPPAEWDWVLWTPEGFYEATPGAEDALRWVVNHGPERAATTLPVSAIAKLHRPDALKLVLDQLETARALGIDDVAAARIDVQRATGSAKPPGGVLHVLAVGVNNFGLQYAADDARDVATALLNSQKGGPGRSSLYADVDLTALRNEKANRTAIKNALDALAERMAKNPTGQDLAVILISSHGEMIDGQFYFIPYGFVADGTRNDATDSALSASDFARKVAAVAAHGKVLILLDACRSGAVGAQGWAKDPDAKLLQDALDLENVNVLSSSRRSEKSQELPEWKHGALTQAFLDALIGAADVKGIVTVSRLQDAMENEIAKLTHDRQHLGMHRNFSGDLFVAAGHDSGR